MSKSILPNAVVKLLLAAAVVCGVRISHAAETITISTGEWAPFVSESLQHYGVAPRIVTAAFEQVGIKVEYQFFPWARAMKVVEDGQADLSGFWFFNEERAGKFNYTESLVDSPNVFFYRKDKPFDWDNFENFPAKVIGTTLSYSYSQAFDTAVESGKVNVEVEETDILNFRKLIRGRIDAFPIAELVGHDLLRTEFSRSESDLLAVHETKISAAPLHLIGSKSQATQQTIELFDKGLAMLKSSGEYKAILDSYR